MSDKFMECLGQVLRDVGFPDRDVAEIRSRLTKKLSLVQSEKGMVGEVEDEVERAVAKFPTWPTDPLHALAVLGEEFGELTKAMLQFTYEPHKTSREEIREEALQTAAMALRLYRSLSVYDYKPGAQHVQR